MNSSLRRAEQRPDIGAGEEFNVTWLVRAVDGKEYYITDYWTRIKVEDTERVGDAVN